MAKMMVFIAEQNYMFRLISASFRFSQVVKNLKMVDISRNMWFCSAINAIILAIL